MSTNAYLSPEFISELASVLRANKVRHEPLTEGTPHLNLNVSDRSRIFVKVARTGERYERATTELVGARWATEVGLNTCTPVMDEVLQVADETGAARAVTVWQWLEPVTPPAMCDQVGMVADLLIEVALTPAPAQADTFNLDYFVDRAHARLAGDTDTRATLITQAIDEAAERIRSDMDLSRHLWIHGDLHLENVLWQVTGRPALLDWESHVRGPVEFDIAQLFRSIYLHFPKHAASEKARVAKATRQRLDSRLEVDWALVETFSRFRAASSASHLLAHGHAPRKLALEMSMLEVAPFRQSLAA